MVNRFPARSGGGGLPEAVNEVLANLERHEKRPGLGPFGNSMARGQLGCCSQGAVSCHAMPDKVNFDRASDEPCMNR